MNILCTKLYQEQLEGFLTILAEQDVKASLDFKLYLDTIMLNLPTKLKKYKQSIYFNDENIRDIEHKGLTITFLIDEDETFVLLGIAQKEEI